MKEDYLNNPKYREMQLILEEEELKIDRIKESDLKIYLNNGKVYYEFEGVELLRKKYEELRKKYNTKWKKPLYIVKMILN